MLYYVLMDYSMTPQEIVLALVFTIVAFSISLSLHEFAHGFLAYKMGDDTPRLAGRLSINPMRHIDGMGLLSFMLVGFGWAKPMPVNPLKFKKYKKGMRLVSIAGVTANFVLGLLAALLYILLINTVGFPALEMAYLYQFLEYFMLVNSFMVMFNILPIFPLDGFNFVSTFFKHENKFLTSCIKNGMKIMFAIIIGSVLFELFFGFDILGWYLSVIYNYLYVPIVFLGVL